MNLITVACGVIRSADGKILAARRSASMSNPLCWEFPGGKLEGDETAEICLIREIREELNIEIEIVTQLPAVGFRISDTCIIKLLPLICNWKSGEVELLEHQAAGWFNLAELEKLDWSPADVPVLRDYRAFCEKGPESFAS